MNADSRPTLLVISQVYVPDPTALGQQMADAAAEMVARGYRVVVLTSRRGYEDPSQVFAAREVRDGVEIRRLPLSSFGKRSIPLRLAGGALFLLQAILWALAVRRLKGLLISTSPPMCSLAAVVVSILRRVPVVYWVMDINPDQAVALGKFAPGSAAVRAFERLNRAILRRAARVVTLDRFMAERLRQKHEMNGKLAVIPPWPLEDSLEPIEHAHNPFRRQHGLEGKFVFMYSGNISLVHSLDTFLEAALYFEDRDDVVFMVVGGGRGKGRVEQFVAQRRAKNIRLLPYQPLEQLRYSLSAADVHLVSMGADMVGIVHPCKVYGSMACGRPVLYLGPQQSATGELILGQAVGWQVNPGDVDGAVVAMRKILALSPERLAAMGRRARQAVSRELSKDLLCGRFAEVVEAACEGRTASDGWHADGAFDWSVGVPAAIDPQRRATNARPQESASAGTEPGQSTQAR